MTTNKYPQTWELDSLLPHPETDEFQTVLNQYRTDLTALADSSDNLPAVTNTPEAISHWNRFIADYTKVQRRAVDLNALTGCYASGDAMNKLYQQLESLLVSLDPLREKISTNIEFQLQSASEDDLTKMLTADEPLNEIAFFFQQRRLSASFRLPKEQELLFADLAVDGLHAWGRLYDRLSGMLRIAVMEKGEVVEKSVGQVQFDSEQRAVRENNFYAADKAWSTLSETAADAINHIAGTRLTKYRSLGLKDHLEMPLMKNRMTRETLNSMWGAVTERKPMLQKYLQKKAEILGLEKLSWYDIDAPLPLQGDAGSGEISYDDASDLIIKTFTQFSPDFGDFAKMAIEKGWIEAENRDGKRQGGFCTGFPTSGETRIFMTFTNSTDSMSTLAHELGHSYHSWVLRERPYVLQGYPMNLAETASTFAEAVLGKERLNSAKTPSKELAILDNMLGDSIAFLMNIHARFIFEDQFHQERAAGDVSAERLSELMCNAQKEAYCNSFDDAGWNPNFWISKLHFYITGYPFYNFPYTFGYLLSLGVYALSEEIGDDFPQQYRNLLIATGCQQTEDAVQSTFGYDLREGTFWNKSLDIVEQRVQRFLELAEKVS